MSVTFDTHQFIRRLRASGFDEAQAEGLTEAFSAAQGQADLATRRDLHEVEGNLKRDLREMEVNLKRDLKEVEVNLKRDLKEVEVNLKRDLHQLEQSMTIKLGAMMVVMVGIIAALMKL